MRLLYPWISAKGKFHFFKVSDQVPPPEQTVEETKPEKILKRINKSFLPKAFFYSWTRDSVTAPSLMLSEDEKSLLWMYSKTYKC